MKSPGAFWRANKRVVFIGAVLFLLTAVVYAPVRHFDFINFDDPVYVTANPHVSAGLNRGSMAWAWKATTGANWFPLTWLSLIADVSLSGITPGSLNWTNVLIHAVATVLLFVVFKRLTGAVWPSAFVAFLFALHPQHVESVAWISERKDVLSAVFWMLTLLCYGRYAAKPRPAAYLLTLLCFCLGFLAKPMVVTLPVILCLLDYWPLRRRPPILEKIPFFVFAAAMSITTYLIQQRGGAVRSFDAAPLPARIANALVSTVMYLMKTVWPSHLAIYYPMRQRYAVWQILSAVVILLGTTAIVVVCRRTRPYLLTGWFWYLLALAPVIGIIQVGSQARADRYTYLPLIGVFVMIVWSCADLWELWPPFRIPLAAACAAAAFSIIWLSSRQIGSWQDSVTIFQHALGATRDNALAHDSLGSAWRAELLNDEAISEYRKALAVDPHYFSALFNLGSVLGSEGRAQEALTPLGEAVKVAPNDAAARDAFGLALGLCGRHEESLVQYREAIRLSPDLADAHFGLGTTLAKIGRLDEAIAEFAEALRLQPDLKVAQQSIERASALKNQPH